MAEEKYHADHLFLAGMFLYAKVILSCLDFLSDIREVRKELEVLPTNLDDA